jgi:ActR/RegA family two-component response regulator
MSGDPNIRVSLPSGSEQSPFRVAGPGSAENGTKNEARCALGLTTQTQEASDKTSPSTGLKLKVPDEARILIVCDDDSITERLNFAFGEAGFISEFVKSITAGCESARSGRFQVIVTTPLLGDGSWRRLVDMAAQYDSGFVVILVAVTFDIQEWTEALEYGAFDVLDALYELPKAAEVAKRAVWAAYLKGGGPDPRGVIRPLSFRGA